MYLFSLPWLNWNIGHGGYTEDEDGDEDDGYDEVIYPVDFKEAGHIVDDEMHAIMVKPLLPGVRLTAIFDSCHSGTALDLPYVYSTKGVLKEPNLAKEAGEGLLSAVTAYATGDMTRVVSSIIDFGKKALKGDKAHEYTKATRTSPADVIMWSGSKDDQTSSVNATPLLSVPSTNKAREQGGCHYRKQGHGCHVARLHHVSPG